jgi:predicted nuclease of predicted toxin-antitoxin system
MKLLLDENIPIKLKQVFSSDFEVFTAKDMSWQGQKKW